MQSFDEDCGIVEFVGHARRWADDAPGVLAIDVGKENMSVCVLRIPGRNESPAVETWRCGALESVSPDGVADFFGRLGFFDPAYRGPFEIVVEKQMAANPTAVRLQSYIEMLFFSRGWMVYASEPRTKFDGPVGIGLAAREELASANTYYKRKALAVEIARRFVSADPGNVLEWSEAFESAPKKDDLADALMHALTHARKRGMI
jgi:hypothetical protein